MKKHPFFLLLLLLLGSINTYSLGNNGDLRIDNGLEAADIAAFTDWKLINRIEREYNILNAKYANITGHFRVDQPIDLVSEALLGGLNGLEAKIWNYYEYGSIVWNTGNASSVFYSEILPVRNELQSYSKDLIKRIKNAGDYISYEDDQKQLSIMRDLLDRIHLLLIGFDYCIDWLEYHKAYCILYDSVEHIIPRYSYLLNTVISEAPSERSSAMTIWIRDHIRDDNQYSLTQFVKKIEADIVTLQSNVSLLRKEQDYYIIRPYTHCMINCLIEAKNLVKLDPHYQEELGKNSKNK